MPVPEEPLKGVRVIEAGPIPAGTIAGAILADWGADVIRISKPGGDDPLKAWWGGRYAKDGVSLVHKVQHRNKRMITLDLSKPEAAPVFRKLVGDADVLLENFRPGTMEGWGYAWEALQSLNPRLIFCRISGFGQTGPYRDRPADGRIAEAFGGFSYIDGYADGPPLHSQMDMGGSLAGSWAAMGMMMALYWRDAHGGRGQVIDVAAYEPIYRQMQSHITAYARTGQAEKRSGNRKSGGVPWVDSHTTKDGKHFTYSAVTRATIRDQMKSMGLDQDPRFPDLPTVGDRRDEYHDAAAKWMAERTVAEVDAAFQEFAAASTPVMNAEDLVNDPQVKAREMVITVEDSDLGPVRMPGLVPKFSKMRSKVRHAGLRIDAHNDEVYRELLGMTPAEIEALRKAGAV